MSTEGVVTDGPVRLVAGRYQLRELLGRGGMGCVWRAEDQLLRRAVAVKEIAFPPSLSEGDLDILRERTLREARAAARIDSAAAVRVYDVVEDEGRPCIVMELVEGRTLRDAIRQDGPLTAAQTARVGLALTDALESAHAAGIVHRDVKPGNVLLRTDGRVTLTDFGIARTAGDPSITSTGLLLGSPSYISPERAKGGAPLPASDMWSLGATLYTAVEGRPPFDRGEPFSTLAAVVGEPPGSYFAAGALAPVIDRLLDKDPAGRPTPAQARRMLAAVAADPANDRTAAAPTAAAALAPAEHTIVLPAAPRPTAPVAAAPAAAPTTPAPRLTPTPAPAARTGRGSERLAGGMAVLLLVLGLGTVAAVLFLRDTSPGDTASQRGTTSPSPGAGRPTPSQSPSAPLVVAPPVVAPTSPAPAKTPGSSSPPSSAGAGLPAGWGRYTDPVGYSYGHPAAWTQRSRSKGVEFVNPSGGYVRVDSQRPPSSSALAALQAQEKTFRAKYPGYQRLQLKTISIKGTDDAAVWEFTFPVSGTTQHGLDVNLATGGRGYALYYQGLDATWATSQDQIDAFFASFRPAP
ncbi:MAG: serine/threonine-protein kinase [Mycobacteriales bacterium]